MTERTQICKSGTIVEIINDGSDGGPWQAMMKDREAEMDMLVSSPVAIDARVGDSLHGTGYYQENVLPSLPPSFVIGENPPVGNRLQDSIAGGATVLSNGKTAGDAAFRPGMIAMTQGVSADTPVMAMSQGPGVTVVRGYDDSTRSDVVKWAKEMIGQVPGNDLIAIVDPHAFSPSELSIGASKDPVNSAVDAIHQALPEDMRDIVSAGSDRAKKIEGQRPFSGYDDNAGGMMRAGRRSIVMPFNPYETGTKFALSMSGIGPGKFFPKQVASPETRQGYVMAHELAHSVQHRYGFAGKKGDVAETNGKECFADSFALLANAQRLGSTAELQDFARYRHARNLAGTMSHATGNACDAALARADELLATGQLQSMTADDMLKMAAEISNEHSLSAAQIEAIEKDRRANYGGGVGISQLAKGGYTDRNGGATMVEIVRGYDELGLIDGPSGDMLRKAVKAVDELTFGPDDIGTVISPKELWERYGKDLNETSKAVAAQGGAPSLLVEAEQQYFKPPEPGQKPKNHPQLFGAQLGRVQEKLAGTALGQQGMRATADTSKLVSFVQTGGPDVHVKQALAADPNERYSTYLSLLDAEAHGQGRDDIAKTRAAYAYAMLADPQSASFVKDRGGMDALMHFRRSATDLNGTNTAEERAELFQGVEMVKDLGRGGQPSQHVREIS